jgi:hypothetical protein
MMSGDEEIRQIAAVVDRLVVAHTELTREQIRETVDAAYARFSNGRVRDFVPPVGRACRASAVSYRVPIRHPRRRLHRIGRPSSRPTAQQGGPARLIRTTA